MELRVLQYFMAVAREESISRAAETLHVTQPTLSRQLAQMEGELGVKLFHRGTRKITLTEEGLLLRRRAEEILELVDKTEEEVTHAVGALEGTVTVGCGDLAGVQKLPPLFRAFQERYPAVTFDLYTGTADQVKDKLDRGLADVGLLLEPVDMGRYDFIRFREKEQWVVAMRPDAPLAAKEAISPEDLKDVPLILPRRLSVQSELAHWFGPLYPQLHAAFTANLPSNSSVMVHHGLAYALIIKGSIRYWDPSVITWRPLSPDLTATCALAWRRLQPLSRAAEKFVEFARAHLETSPCAEGMAEPC